MMAKATSTKKPTAKKKATAKSKAQRPSIPVVAEQPAVVTPPAEPQTAIQTETETATSAVAVATQPAPKPASKAMEAPKTARTSNRKGKPTSGIAALKFEALAAKDAFLALHSCGCRFDEAESSGMKKLGRFVIKHSTAIDAGQKVDQTAMARTIGLARRIAENLI